MAERSINNDFFVPQSENQVTAPILGDSHHEIVCNDIVQLPIEIECLETFVDNCNSGFETPQPNVLIPVAEVAPECALLTLFLINRLYVSLGRIVRKKGFITAYPIDISVMLHHETDLLMPHLVDTFFPSRRNNEPTVIKTKEKYSLGRSEHNGFIVIFIYRINQGWNWKSKVFGPIFRGAVPHKLRRLSQHTPDIIIL